MRTILKSLPGEEQIKVFHPYGGGKDYSSFAFDFGATFGAAAGAGASVGSA
jgi:hypothetical protein